MGNSPATIFRHYRQLVKPKQAERYWKIVPAVAGKKVVQFAAAHEYLPHDETKRGGEPMPRARFKRYE